MRKQEMIAAIRQDILSIGCIYRTIGEVLFDEAVTRLAQRTAATAERYWAEDRTALLEACKQAVVVFRLMQFPRLDAKVASNEELARIAEHALVAAIAAAEPQPA